MDGDAIYRKGEAIGLPVEGIGVALEQEGGVQQMFADAEGTLSDRPQATVQGGNPHEQKAEGCGGQEGEELRTSGIEGGGFPTCSGYVQCQLHVVGRGGEKEPGRFGETQAVFTGRKRMIPEAESGCALQTKW